MADRFNGIPAEAFEFYERLSADNTRAWWQANRGDYECYVREPLTELVDELTEEFGAAKLFRPYRDARFSKDKTPIKDHQGAVVGVEDAVAYYVQISANGLMTAGGWYAPEGQQVQHYREAVDSAAGAELARIVASLAKRFEVDGNPLKTQPRGYEADHARIDLLRNRRLVVSRTYPVAGWMGTRKALTAVRADWRATRPLVEWLADRVGPAIDPAR
jgi:uncharacterized protein (TIGR02453 family)